MSTPDSSSSPPPPPSSPNDDPRPTQAPEPANQDERARNLAYAERYAEVSLKSRPLPEGFDPNQHATIGQAVKTIKPDDFLNVHRTPCAREGMLAFTGGGMAIGGLRYVLGAPLPKAANWAVYSGAALSIITYEFCQYQRRVEKHKMKRVVEVYTKAQAEQKKLEGEKQRQQQLASQAAAQEEAQKPVGKSWYKFW